MARLAHALAQLRTQVNQAFPGRGKASDGWIGDEAHAASNSEHNPNRAGVVRALDITHDPANGVDGALLAADAIAEMDRRGAAGYVIHAGRIRSTILMRGVWRKYSGSNPHNSHVHISYITNYDDRRAWDLPTLTRRVVSLGGGMTSPIGKPTVVAKGSEAPAWPLPSSHLIYHNPRKRATWHDGHGDDTTGRAAIRTWQRRMKDRGWSITPDGFYGPATERVTRQFQAEKGLIVDGIIGPATWAAAWTSSITN